jgi:ribosomal protein S18 acetylase RimI-like enzyme
MRLAQYNAVNPTKSQRVSFDCGETSLNRWLSTQARQSMESRDAVTFLLLDDEEMDDGNGDASPASAESRIAGYFALSAGQVFKEAMPLEMGRRAPDPVPAIRMGRFAVDSAYQGQGLGAELLSEALLRSVSAGGLIGARVMLVDAISDAALAFYLRFGFRPSPIHPLQVCYDLRVVAASAGIGT